MTTLRKKWVATLAVALVLVAGALVLAASIMAKRIEPTIRQQAILYLRKRFDSDVELGRLQVRVPPALPFRLIFGLGRGTLAKVEGTDLSLRLHGRRGIPPLLSLKHFSFEFDLGALLDTPKTVNLVTLDDLEI